MIIASHPHGNNEGSCKMSSIQVGLLAGNRACLVVEDTETWVSQCRNRAIREFQITETPIRQACGVRLPKRQGSLSGEIIWSERLTSPLGSGGE